MGGEAGSRQDAGGTERPTLAPSGPPRRARAKCARMGHPLSETFEPSVLQAFLRHSCWEENPGRACWFAGKKLAQKSWNQH